MPGQSTDFTHIHDRVLSPITGNHLCRTSCMLQNHTKIFMTFYCFGTCKDFELAQILIKLHFEFLCFLKNENKGKSVGTAVKL